MSQIAKIETQIAQLQDKLAKLKAAEQSAAAMANLAAGSEIRFVYGRGETRAARTGTVLAIAETDKGTKIKVQYGEGFDVELAVIDAGAVLGVVGEGKAESAPEADPLAAAAGDASADPLASIN